MSQDPSIAPRERVNIRYKSATGDASEDRELPLKLLLVGDYTQREDDTPLAERDPINVNKNNFNKVLAAQELKLNLGVPNALEEQPAGEEAPQLAVSLSFNTLKDFTPEAIARQVPELNKLLELRQALTALKSPLGNNREFKKKIRSLIEDPAARQQILDELGTE